MERTIGRYKTNDKQIDQPDISSNHAKVTKLEDGFFLVEDLDSTNGTYVNGYPIKRAKVSLKDTVSVSDTLLDIAQLFNETPIAEKVKENPLDFIKEFAALEKIWDNYEVSRKKIKKRLNFKTNAVRFGVIALFYILFFIVKAIFKENDEIATLLNTLLFLVPFIANSIASFYTGNIDTEIEYKKLRQEYRNLYACPKCKLPFGMIDWFELKDQPNCKHANCKAQYNK